MILHVIGSGSDGNGYILCCNGEQLILECGMRFELIEKALNYDLKGVVGACISHNHLDHAAFAKQYSSMGIKLYSTKRTLDAIGTNKHQRVDVTPLKLYRIGSFRILPFRTQHDAADPCGFLIDCPDGNRVVFATDTYYLKYTFPKVNYFMVECNYAKEKLHGNVKAGIVHPAVARRITESHMSLASCCKMLQANDLTQTKGIILLHLSKDNSIAKEAVIDTVQRATGKPVYIAQKSTTINLL